MALGSGKAWPLRRNAFSIFALSKTWHNAESMRCSIDMARHLGNSYGYSSGFGLLFASGCAAGLLHELRLNSGKSLQIFAEALWAAQKFFKSSKLIHQSCFFSQNLGRVAFASLRRMRRPICGACAQCPHPVTKAWLIEQSRGCKIDFRKRAWFEHLLTLVVRIVFPAYILLSKCPCAAFPNAQEGSR